MNDLSIKSKLLIFVGYTALVVALTYWFSPTKVETVIQKVKEQQIQIDESKTKQNKENKDTHKKTITKTVKKPDGTVVTTIKTVEDSVLNKDSKIDSSKDTTKTITETDTKSKTVERSRESLSLGLVAGINLFSGTTVPIYGLTIQKHVLGPIFIQGLGQSNGIISIGAGISF